MKQTPFEVMLNELDWKELEHSIPEDDIPVATHEGVLDFGGTPLRVYQLSNGQRVIESSDLQRFFGFDGSE